ncbi:hypothetical protein B0H13DRAFT_2314565 [Mycena leptocephala]|nr:hypothetical protein B0H13DRAFT_2314565 [Mycena leptocephala]
MSDHTKQPKPKLLDELQDGLHKFTLKVEDGWHKLTPKRSPAPSPQPSRSTTPVPSNRQGSSPSATAILPASPESAPMRADNGEDSLKGAKTDAPDTAQSKPGSSLDTLDAVEDFIPDSPFPAKTLVKALLSIVKLGIRVPLIQKKVYDFAQEAIEYIHTLVEVVGEQPTAKKDLEAICTAVNEICKWASEHVLKTALSADDLGDWSSKFAKAKEMFLATTVLQIRVAQANKERKDFIKEKLANHVATKHEYTDQSKSLCADDTRVDIQAEIVQWLSPQPSNRERIFWITGIPGSGKSTLSATVVDNLRKNHTPVAAQFFISRNIPETIDPNKIIPTIAQKLSDFSPAAARIIHDALKDGFPYSREEQVKALLLAPIRELSKSCDVVVILIDALDELHNAASSVLEILSPIAKTGCDVPDNIRFVITSRPEHWADISRSETLELAVFKQHSLGTESSVNEIHNFIVARMREITPKEPGWDGWPSADQLLKLSERANGLFHYAATTLHWIEGRIHKSGTASRNSVFEKFIDMGIGQLEDLYKLVLTSFENIDETAEDPQLRVNQLRGFQRVIGTILVLDEPLTIRQITALLADILEDDFDVANFLQQFRSVLIPGMTVSFEEGTPQMHKSFRDYIVNDHAPTGFRIRTGDAHFVTARSCLEVIVKAGSQSDIDCKYSVRHWHQHLRQAVEEGATFGDERMWDLFGGMVEKAVVKIWAKNSMDVFIDVTAAGWGLLKDGENFEDSNEGKRSVCFPLSPVIISLILPCFLISRRLCVCRKESVLFPHHPCSSRSLCLTFSSLGCGACFAPVPMLVLLTLPCLVSREECVLSSISCACLTHFASPSHLQRNVQSVCFPPSPVLIWLTLLAFLSLEKGSCFPPSPVLILLTLPCLLVSREEFVLSSIARAHLAHFVLPSRL